MMRHVSRPARVVNAFGEAIYPSIDFLEGHCRFGSEQYGLLRRQVSANQAISASGASSSTRSYSSLSEHVLVHEPLRFYSNEEEEVKLLVGPDLESGRRYLIRFVSDLPGQDRILRPSGSTTLSYGQERLYRKFTAFLTQVHVGFLGLFRCANRLVQVNMESEEAYACELRGDRPIPVYRELIPSHVRLTQVLDFRLEGRNPLHNKMFHVTDSGRIRPSDLRDRIIYLG